MPMAELARAVGRGESTVRERVAALEERKVILGYHANVNPVALGHTVRAIIRAESTLKVTGALGPQLAAIPNVISAHTTTGAKPIRIEVVAGDLADLERLMRQRIANLPLTDLEVTVVLDTLVPHRPIPVNDSRATIEDKSGDGEGRTRDGVGP